MTGSGVGEADALTPRAARALAGGTVTFLLTDVEGSSRHWEADAGAAATLARHEAVIADCVAGHGGARPVEQGEGDSSVAVFARASDAAACAVEIQRALGGVRWPDGGGLRVRVALHTGEAELRDDGTYRGSALNRCARLRSIGHGGQILVSQACCEVITEGLPSPARLRDLGSHRLRDLARPEHVWQLCHPGLVEEFPPLLSLDGVPHNLPVQLTTFIGREAEVEVVRGLLRETRLLTLTGAGGCGKTRLAVQVAAELLEDYPEGLWWVDLGPVTDPALVPSAVAAAVGVREAPPQPLTETLVRRLAPGRALLVLDNCEHQVAACAALAERLLRGCPAIGVVATSREPLGIGGETTWRVPSLTLPPAGAPSPGAFTQSESVRLFVDRVVRVRSNFRVTHDTAPAVAEICRRLDGIPLAIELAASRTRMLTPEQIAAGLSDRFHLLTGGARGALARQRTLEASVDWSHDLLDAAERCVFRRLAVFAGSFSLDAAEAVCAGDGIQGHDVLDLLGHLVDRSLVQVEAQGPRARYRLLETVRYYARVKLLDAGEAAAVQDRHLDYYAAVAEDAAPHLEGPHLLAWLDRLDEEIDNLRAAMDWSPTSSDPSRGLRIAGWLTLFWLARSQLAEARTRLEAALGCSTSQDVDRCQALTALCHVAMRAGDMPLGRRCGEEAVALGRRIGDPRTLAFALHSLAVHVIFSQPNPRIALSLANEAITAARAAEDDLILAAALNTAGTASWATGEPPRCAREHLTEGQAVARGTGSLYPLVQGLVTLGWIDVLEGRFDDAATRLDEALIRGLGGAVADQQRFEEAARLFGAAQSLRDTIGYARYPIHQAGHDSDLALARDSLGSDAFAAAWAEGAALSLDEAVAYARRGRGQRKRPSHGWNSLTPTEHQIVALVAKGLTNPQIGDRLFISRRTVQTHLIHVFAKLDVATRAELAATATRHRPND
jgi:predicted ATPase/class 3 adenylate cyclase/DNA-binding CsgD family transcriptional regulator